MKKITPKDKNAHCSIVIACSLFIASTILSACAPLPSTARAPAAIKTLDTYKTRQSLAGAPDGKWPQEAWWRNYDDAQLDALIKEGLQNAPSMTVAEARLRRAMAMTQISDSASQPQLNASVKPTLEKQSYHYLFPKSYVPQGWNDYGMAGLNFNWEIDFWGKHKAALAAATSLQEARAAEVAEARLTLATAIASSYGELARLYALQDNAKAAVATREKSLDLLKQRHAQGMEMLANVKQSQARKASVEEELLAINEQVALQRNRIAALLGAGPDRGLTLERPSIKLIKKFTLPEQLQLNLLGRRPDIVAARLQVNAMTHSIEKQKAAFYPNVNLAAMIGLQSLGLNRLAQSDSYMGSVGPAVTLPLLTGGRLQGELRSAQADRDEAVGVYNNAVTQALQEVANAIVSQKALTQQIQKLQEATDAASEAHRIIHNRYRVGLASYLDVLMAEEALLASQHALRDLQSRSFIVDVALIKALGGGYQTQPQ